MPSERHNTQAGEEQRGSSGDNIRRQQRESRDPAKSNARDETGRKGGNNAKNLQLNADRRVPPSRLREGTGEGP
jgi:hypothetical protein